MLPSVLAGVLFLVLAGLLALTYVGLTKEPMLPEMAAAESDASADGKAPALPATPAEPMAREAAPPQDAAPPAVEPPAGHGDAGESAAEPRHGTASEAFEQMAAPPQAPETAAAATEAPPHPLVANEPPPPPAPPVAPPVASSGHGLAPAPDPALVETSPLGPLPRIGPNGREPWRVYARPFDVRDSRPRVAVILSGLGLSSAATEAAIQGLPGEVTLAFQPYADIVQQWIGLARAAGHEVLLNLPMEPVDFPESDPGRRALFVTLSPDENEERLRWALSRVSGYVGVVNHMGSRFTTVRDAMQPVLAELKARGLLFVDARAAAHSVATVMASQMQVPRAINDRFLDDREVSRATVDARLAEIERIAKEAGVSIAIGQGFPVTIERLRAWTETLDAKGLALAPVSAVVGKQADR